MYHEYCYFSFQLLSGWDCSIGLKDPWLVIMVRLREYWQRISELEPLESGTDSSVVGSGPFALDSDIIDIIVIVICHSSKTLTDIRKGDVKTLVEQKRVYTKSLVILF